MPPRTKKADRPKYRVLIGLNYPDARKGQPEKRAEPGDVVDDLPSLSVEWLLARGAIERAG